jgi:hypothetical protein
VATITERLQALYAATLTKLETAMATVGPNITVDGVTIDRLGYIRELQDQLKELEKKPGVVPEVNPTFEFDEYR